MQPSLDSLGRIPALVTNDDRLPTGLVASLVNSVPKSLTECSLHIFPWYLTPASLRYSQRCGVFEHQTTNRSTVVIVVKALRVLTVERHSRR